MTRGKTRRPSHATIVAYLALFVALGGTATALSGRNSVHSDDIAKGQVKARDLGAAAVTAPKLSGGAVDSAALSPDSVTSGKVAPGSLSGSDLAPNSLTGGQIDEASLQIMPRMDTLLMSHFIAPDSFATPVGFGPLSGTAASTGTEDDVLMVSPGVPLIARDLRARFHTVSLNSARRITLRVNQTDTALSCTVGAGSNLGCSAPTGTTVPVPAGSLLSWTVDDTFGSFTTEPTPVEATVRLLEG